MAVACATCRTKALRGSIGIGRRFMPSVQAAFSCAWFPRASNRGRNRVQMHSRIALTHVAKRRLPDVASHIHSEHRGDGGNPIFAGGLPVLRMDTLAAYKTAQITKPQRHCVGVRRQINYRLFVMLYHAHISLDSATRAIFGEDLTNKDRPLWALQVRISPDLHRYRGGLFSASWQTPHPARSAPR